MTYPVEAGGPYELPALPGYGFALWEALLEIADVVGDDWTLIGGQMVLLHAIEHGRTPPRVSTDLDVLVNARATATDIEGFVRTLASIGFELAGVSPDGVAHRYQRGAASVDVLAPDGLGSRTSLTTTRPGRTIAVPGGTQALQRSELVGVRAGEVRGQVPRPNLLGAIVAKSCAVDVDDASDAQRADLVFLLSLIGDAFEMRDALTRKDRQRLARRRELTDDHRAWATLAETDARQAKAAWRLLNS